MNGSWAGEDEDTVLDHQPRDLATPPATTTYPDDDPFGCAESEPHNTTESSSLPSTDPHDYDYAVFFVDPAQYPPHELLRPPSPDAKLQISMGRVDGWDLPPAILAMKKQVITGADHMRGAMYGDGEPLCQFETRRMPSPPKEEKSKPHLTIDVPVFTNRHRRAQSYGVKGSAGYSPYPRRAAMQENISSVRTDAGDDILDWGEELECDPIAEDDAVTRCGKEAHEVDGWDIRRVRSTPPTPRSSVSSIDVPMSPSCNLRFHALCERRLLLKFCGMS